MYTGKQKQMNASYQASLVNRHIRRFTGNVRRAQSHTYSLFLSLPRVQLLEHVDIHI